MKKSESLLWQRIKKLKLKGQIFRIESNTINGIADVYWLVNGKSIWIELKSNDVKNLGLSKYHKIGHLDGAALSYNRHPLAFDARGGHWSHSIEPQT